MIARLEGNHGGLALSSTPKKLNLKNTLFFLISYKLSNVIQKVFLRFLGRLAAPIVRLQLEFAETRVCPFEFAPLIPPSIDKETRERPRSKLNSNESSAGAAGAQAHSICRKMISTRGLRNPLYGKQNLDIGVFLQ